MTISDAFNHLVQATGLGSAEDTAISLRRSRHGAPLPAVSTERYQRIQFERTLTLALWIAMGTSICLLLINVVFLHWPSVISLALLSALCPLLLELTSRGQGRLAGVALVGLILGVAAYNLVMGRGLGDPGVVAFPIIVVLGGMLLGKRSLPWVTLTVLATLATITWLGLGATAQHQSALRPRELHDLITVSVLTVAAALVVLVSMDNTERNIRRILRSKAKVRAAYEDTLEAWARALEYRDRETEGHSRRVTELSDRLARAAGIDGEELVSIRWGSLLHDVGKLAIPDAVLLKPGPLDETERALMELHPVYAHEMLSRIRFLQPVMAIPYHHHEHWDGTGYPEGLAGEEIPLAARIFTVVDQWEALTSDRPYRAAWPRERAIAYLKENAGTIFDPVMVELFLRHVAPYA